MICERILGRVDDDADVDWVEIEWPQTVRRALRLKSRSGRQVDVLLPPNSQLRHGDLLYEVRSDRIALSVRPCELLELSPMSPQQLAEVATHFGNLHVPVELIGSTIRTPDDGPSVEIAETLGVPFRRIINRFHPIKVSVQSPLVRSE